MRVIIICAGNGIRWGNYLGVPKHFISINGKKLIQRTVDQFQGEDIYIVANSTEYQIDGTKLYYPAHESGIGGADKILNSSCLWSNAERTLLVFGDVYFTDEAIKIIKNYPKLDWAAFGRAGRSNITGCSWGELFAFSFHPEQIKDLNYAIDKAISHYKQGCINRCQGWEIYRVWDNIDPRVHDINEHFVEINDFTDDFDFPGDYDLWMYNYAKQNNDLK